MLRRAWQTIPMRLSVRSLVVFVFAVATIASAQIIDYHQHLYSPFAGPISIAGWKGVSADELVSLMDAANIRRAVVLSTAYSLANPHKAAVPNEHEAVRKDNDWTSAQIAKHLDRLIGFCSVNPLRSYAVEEIDRCAKDPSLRTGLKLHFGNSDVDVDNLAHLTQLKEVFRAANRNRMAILVHAHANVNLKRSYGAPQARVFLEQLLPEAPDIAVVLAHMAGAGGFGESTQQASAVYAKAIAQHDVRVRNLYFDACLTATAVEAPLLVQRIREIGLSRIFYGSDAPIKGNYPTDALQRWHSLPLTAVEFRLIETNVAPFLQPVRSP
jgi:predicted TIM-barrel fold metal-dependent hydrolase